MISILVSRITPEGILLEGEDKFDFNGDVSENILSAPLIKYELRISLINNGIVATGSASTIITCRCDRCTDVFEKTIINNEICHFYEKTNKNEIDLTDDIHEDILILFPHKLLCNDLCKGICFKCGKKLNVEKCICNIDSEDASTWNSLNKLKL